MNPFQLNCLSKCPALYIYCIQECTLYKSLRIRALQKAKGRVIIAVVGATSLCHLVRRLSRCLLVVQCGYGNVLTVEFFLLVVPALITTGGYGNARKKRDISRSSDVTG